MPYSMPDNIPDYIKNLPQGAQRIFVDAFNASMERDSDEDKARQAGWGAVKNAYHQQGDEWVRNAAEIETLRYVAMVGQAPAEGTNESQVQVFRTGTFRHPIYGKFTITDDDLDRMQANFKAHRPKPPTELTVDYEHMSAIGNQVAPAAGWVKSVEHTPGELWATVSWTDRAAGMIRAKEYRFVSPEWHMHYRDKESGKDIGATLLSMALTNRPFIEGMQPVMLSEKLEEYNAGVLMLSEKMLGLFVPQEEDHMRAAEWDQEYINDLPDEAFAYIEPGGEKDEKGKTVPRGNRHLPFKNMDGSVNLDHLRNALARLDQTSLSQAGKTEARRKLEKAAQEAGVGEQSGEDNKNAQEVSQVEEQIRELLGLGPDDDIMAALKELKAKADKTEEATQQKTEAEQAQQAAEQKLQAKETELATATGKLTAAEVTTDVDQALKDGHILPKQVEWAKSLRAKDPEGFKAFLASAPTIGPDNHIIGREGDEDAIQLTETEEKIGKRMGVSREDLIKQKQKDAEAAKVTA